MNKRVQEFIDMQKSMPTSVPLTPFQEKIGVKLNKIVGGYQNTTMGREARRQDIIAITELIVTDVIGDFDDEFYVDYAGESKNSLRDQQLKTVLGEPPKS